MWRPWSGDWPSTHRKHREIDGGCGYASFVSLFLRGLQEKTIRYFQFPLFSRGGVWYTT